ncbi:unnamed protein product [Didymodactylos carnosus]|uniref:Uncharacterized protein n=1 Tax=Didymodactylos carnosus TaxID=1234261 RepID=A0A815ZWE8_9BILA|nr:unnamed protein product [Didymodactylos carnosus]CAF4458704.1 unnamed protein product [Didymodactylos carnosus]
MSKNESEPMEVDEPEYATFINGWLQLRDNSKIDQFLIDMTPSKINRSTGCAWISVHNQSKEKNFGTSNIDGLCQEYKLLGKQLSVSRMEHLARKYNVLSGKWMCFVRTSQVDNVWSCIAKAIVLGQLGALAKVQSSELNREICHVICVYTNNYLDLDEREMMKNELKNLLKKSNTIVKYLSYKPDIYTYVGIYHNHPIIPSTIDSVAW